MVASGTGSMGAEFFTGRIEDLPAILPPSMTILLCLLPPVLVSQQAVDGGGRLAHPSGNLRHRGGVQIRSRLASHILPILLSKPSQDAVE